MQNADMHARLFSAAADLASGRWLSEPGLADPALQLLRSLDLVPEDGEAADLRLDLVPNAAVLLQAAARLSVLFRLPAPDMPGLVFVGGEAHPQRLGLTAEEGAAASLAGAALDHPTAFAACVGEGVEYLSQFVRPEDRLVPGGDLAQALLPDAATQASFAAWLGLADPAELLQWRWTPGRRLDGGEIVWLPAGLVFRGLAEENGDRPSVPLGTGCSAGVSRTRAVIAALLETVERDAVALWWHGGQPGRRIGPEVLRQLDAPDLIAQLRGLASDRETTLLDISTELGIPCVAALSFTAAGDGFAAGFAAGIDLGRAVRSALVELGQMELGLRLVDAKRRQRGDDALNDADRRQVERAAGVRLKELPILDPVEDPDSSDFDGDDGEMLAALAGRLARAGHVAHVSSLGRAEFGIPVARVLVPTLQLFPSAHVSPRLSRIAGKNGLHPALERGIDLF